MSKKTLDSQNPLHSFQNSSIPILNKKISLWGWRRFHGIDAEVERRERKKLQRDGIKSGVVVTNECN